MFIGENEYLRLRRAMEQNNQAQPYFHPCKKGFAKCCEEPHLFISSDDIDNIAEGFRSGEFSEKLRTEVIKKASRAKQGKLKQCPFLGNRRECTIYSKRPLICMATGTGGIPTSEYSAGKLDNPATQGLPLNEVVTTMCHSCHNKLLNNSQYRGFSRQALLDFQDLGRYYAERGTDSISSLILNRLTDSSLNGECIPQVKSS